MENKVFIPQKLKVGYQKRGDTYSKKLAYVTYYDEKGKLRKEASWKGWVDKKQGIDEFENVPTEGFVLNRNVGGVRNSYSSWSSDVRIEKVRVYDPRGFEFEIDVPNVLNILQECTSTKGKGLEGTFVYGWSGTRLVLLPTASQDYQESQNYTALQSGKVSSKELIEGASYMTKKGITLIYLGKFPWVEHSYRKGWSKENKFVFVDINALDNQGYYELDIADYDDEEDYNKDLAELNKEREEAIAKGENIQFIPLASVTTLSKCVSETPVSNYAELMDKFNATHNAAMPVAFVERKVKPNLEVKKVHSWWDMKSDANIFVKEGDAFVSLRLEPVDYHSKAKPTQFEIRKNRKMYFDKKGNYKTDYASDNEYPRPKYTKAQIESMEIYSLSMKLENNKVAHIKDYLR